MGEFNKKTRDNLLMKAYQKVGLDAAFSKAIVEGGNAHHIIDTWKADWRGDHGAEHPAIRAVLNGNATPNEAKSLLEAANSHADIVEAVASGQRSIKWAHVVLTSGFKGKSDAVSALLDGADPSIIAHILDIKLHDENAKIIRQSDYGIKSAEITNETKIPSSVKILDLTTTQLRRECQLAYLKKTGQPTDLRKRLKTYVSCLRQVVKGYTHGIFPTPIGGVPGTDTNKHAAKYLEMKTTSHGVYGFKKLILTQSFRYGIINEEEYVRLMKTSSEFNKK